MLKNNEAINLFHIIFPPILRSVLWQLYDIVFILIKLNSKFRTNLF